MKLRPYQLASLAKVRALLRQPRLLRVAPTGSGRGALLERIRLLRLLKG